jgi:hypothetical protein
MILTAFRPRRPQVRRRPPPGDFKFTSAPVAAPPRSRNHDAWRRGLATLPGRLNAPPDLPVVLAGGLLTENPVLRDRTRDHTRRLLRGAPVQTLNRPPVAGAVALAYAAATPR